MNGAGQFHPTPGAFVTDSFGDVTGEYQALHSGSGLVADGHELVTVSGADAASFLDSLLSQDLTALSAASG